MPERAGKPYDFFVAPPDIHEPYSDPKALGAVERFIRHTRPSLVVLLGDNVDFYQLSRFDQDPKRALALQEDCDKTFEAMRRFRKAAPSARIHYLQGNHEDRLRRYLWGKSVALSSLKCLTVPELLRLKELDIRYHESGQFRVKDLLFKHGNVVRKKSGFTAMAELERNWLSGVSGHTHRLSEVYRRTFRGLPAQQERLLQVGGGRLSVRPEPGVCARGGLRLATRADLGMDRAGREPLQHQHGTHRQR